MLSRGDWFWSDERKRDLAAVAKICHQAAPLSAGWLGEEMAWLLYQERTRALVEVERRVQRVFREVANDIG